MTDCPCTHEPLHRRAISDFVDVVWTDIPGCDCLPNVDVNNDEVPLGAAAARALTADLTAAADLMRRIEGTRPGSPARAAIHAEQRCAELDCRWQAAP